MDPVSEPPVASTVSDRSQPAPVKPTSKRASRFIVWLVVLALIAGGVILFRRTSASKARAAAGGKSAAGRGGGAIPVSVARVQKGNMGEYINTLGTVTPVYTATITSRVAGSLTAINYREGEMVHKGDLLAVIDAGPYRAAYIQAQGQLERDQALLANANIDVDRYRSAFQQHAIPEQTLATQQSVVNQDQGTVKIDQGNLEAARVNLQYTEIRSPIDGRVGLRQTDLGNIIQANGTVPLLTVTQLQPMTVIFTMAEDYISEVMTQIRGGHKLRVDALNRDNQTELSQGTLLTLDNQVDTTTGTVRARAVFANRDFKLFPNEFVNAKLLVRTLMGVNIIPNAAIQRNNDVSFVYVVNPDRTVHSRNITAATTDGSNSAVTGVKQGEILVMDGFDKLQEGSKVVTRKAENTGSGPAREPNETEPAAQSEPNAQSMTQGAQARPNKARRNPPIKPTNKDTQQ